MLYAYNCAVAYALKTRNPEGIIPVKTTRWLLFACFFSCFAAISNVSAYLIDVEKTAIEYKDAVIAYEYVIRITCENGDEAPGNQVIRAQFDYNGTPLEIYSALTDCLGHTTMLLPAVSEVTSKVMPFNCKTQSAILPAADDQVQFEVVGPVGPGYACCEQILWCGDTVCGSSCYNATAEECAAWNAIPNMTTTYHSDQVCVKINGVCQCMIEDYIGLSDFRASARNNAARLTWATEAEIDNAGFNIYRADSEDGEYVQINDSLIPSAGSPTEGASYEFVDTGAANRTTYFYMLEDIDLNGATNRHGPVTATPLLIYEILPSR